MHPFYFSSSDKPLFGIYYMPEDVAVSSRGAVLCYPMGQEYMWLHRAYRQLAALLTRVGFHVLRFDYYGCGDSGGDSDEVSLAQWLEDISESIQELRESADVSHVALIGFRLGGSLAAMSASKHPDVTAVVCWDPVIDGKEYLAELRQMQAVWAANNLPADRPISNGTGEMEVIGFPMPGELSSGLEQLDLLKLEMQADKAICLFETIESAQNQQLYQHLQSQANAIQYIRKAGSDAWSKSRGLNPLSVPHDVLQEIVLWTAETCR